jgi:HEPN domain-containing protein
MGPKKKKFNKTYAPELLKIANGDLESAKGLCLSRIGRPENALYHIQQACEKALKAIYIAQGKEVTLIHDIGLLIGGLEDLMHIPHQEELLSLTEYATIRRYEEGTFEISFDTDVTPYLAIAGEILTLATLYVK